MSNALRAAVFVIFSPGGRGGEAECGKSKKEEGRMFMGDLIFVVRSELNLMGRKGVVGEFEEESLRNTSLRPSVASDMSGRSDLIRVLIVFFQIDI